MRALGLELAFDWNSSILTKSDAQLLEEIEGTKRIRALAQIGQDKRAIREIHSLWTKGSLGLIRILPKLANTLGFVETQMMLGKQLSALDDTNLDSAVFPLPNWIPLDGYKIDRALVFALIRQESKFKAKSRSRRGARGLMQLMPRTAKFVAKRSGIVLKDNNDLNDPVINISLGQSYLEYLLTVEVIGDNFFFLLCAYNAGPGNLRKWLEKTNFKDDPLLFAESIRSRETRQFIKSVSTNYWIYRSQLSQRTPSLNATVSGNWPKYLKQE
jgi:soluble lytic murein transglycosylase-like protein